MIYTKILFTAPWERGFRKGSLTDEQRFYLNKKRGEQRRSNRKKQTQTKLPNWVIESESTF